MNGGRHREPGPVVRTVVATANIRDGLGRRAAREALAGVLAAGPDLVGLQEWGPGRLGLLREHGRVGTAPSIPGLWAPGTGSSYLWSVPVVGDCVVGARADRYDLVDSRLVPLSAPGRGENPDRWRGIEPGRLLTSAVYRDRASGRTVCLLCFHLVPGVQRGGRYRCDRPLLVARHRAEVRRLQTVIDRELARGRVVHAVGDSNFDGLRLRGLTSAWQGREDGPGTLGPRRQVDDVHGPGPAAAVRILENASDHRAVVATREVG
ncbi:endonuclease/exonuclease/phosphatase family protein [Nocardioides terrisoli]|uniref:endonuclease/exonuclease/phosphatase family protein n=1 Tax=Nocardioides terrisoli TaxID=3388267 RepID=UPI00287B8071|nr:hypothetical protein [Nocardioides marmorisolisilvae]